MADQSRSDLSDLFPQSNKTIGQSLSSPISGLYIIIDFYTSWPILTFPINSGLFDEVYNQKLSLKLNPDKKKTRTPRNLAKQVFRASGRRDEKRRRSETPFRRQTRRKRGSQT